MLSYSGFGLCEFKELRTHTHALLTQHIETAFIFSYIHGFTCVIRILYVYSTHCTLDTAHMRTHICTYVCTHTCTRTYTCVHIYVRMYVHTHAHTHTHACTHGRTHTLIEYKKSLLY